MSLGYLVDANGCESLGDVGRLMKGYPINIDLGKDISLPGDMGGEGREECCFLLLNLGFSAIGSHQGSIDHTNEILREIYQLRATEIGCKDGSDELSLVSAIFKLFFLSPRKISIFK
jgi:hypothetical protein